MHERGDYLDDPLYAYLAQVTMAIETQQVDPKYLHRFKLKDYILSFFRKKEKEKPLDMSPEARKQRALQAKGFWLHSVGIDKDRK